ncbi:1-acyl-sn-glycerol-3-phosphate acyltransferase [Litoreibacter halocynthiae]|uniref:1-acyl-sn-glycerol-3-phosphate acyltransferase n=1 Tax=Litoreibacter halocynthiae TaxID=1242689 RepID=A0A4R7LHU1_9RHOB|nr:lysophospholipid acyltransferase family protein [Litoreibacter halocynthiae]TDT74152.1 1-acyl-sn-glycerol-3-phosphate acyltransferase [Litoreibacter halocynthiae]
MRRFAASIVGHFLIVFAQFITAARADWRGIEPVRRQRIYYANHSSNADLPLIWTVLPAALRRDTRAVAAADYWLKNKLRAFIGRDVFQGILIDRRAEHRTEDPIAKIVEALDEGASIIIFPEGGRNRTEDPLMPFKAGLYNIARQRPEIDLVPCWIDNISHIMPSGEVIPVPLACTVTFGAPVHVREEEAKNAFLKRASDALRDLIPARGHA